jgi:hypothetical protein
VDTKQATRLATIRAIGSQEQRYQLIVIITDFYVYITYLRIEHIYLWSLDMTDCCKSENPDRRLLGICQQWLP